MNNSSFGDVLFAAVVALGVGAIGQPADKPKTRLLSALRKDQPVVMKEIAGRFEITMMNGTPELFSHKVIEVGDDFLVVEDLAAVSETQIPIFSIKSIVMIKSPKN